MRVFDPVAAAFVLAGCSCQIGSCFLPTWQGRLLFTLLGITLVHLVARIVAENARKVKEMQRMDASPRQNVRKEEDIP